MMKNYGFSIIELMVVVSMFAILTAIAIPGFSVWLPNYRLKGAARDAISALQLARLQAVRENANAAVLFDTANNSYEAFIDDGAGGGTADNWIRDGSEKRIIDGIIPEEVTLYEASFSGGVPHVGFNSRGLSIGMGHVYMVNSRNKYMGVSVNMVGSSRITVSTDGENWN